ncbi:MAG: RHS repeat-associated core domain-containing protein [Pseudomonadota bacterium]
MNNCRTPKLTHIFLAISGCLSITTFSAAASTLTTTIAYDYDAASGLLQKEIIEPADSNLCLVTAYTLDAYGHRQTTITRNCNGTAGSVSGAVTEAPAPTGLAVFTPHKNVNAFTTDKRFVSSSTVDLSQNTSGTILTATTTASYESGFGNTLSQTDANGLQTGWAYDNLGRKFLEKRSDGNGTRWVYDYCVGTNGGSLSCPTIDGVTGAYAITTIPVAAPIDLTAKTMGMANGPYTRIYYDKMNREIRTETQGFDGSGSSTLIYQDTKYTFLRDLVSAKSLPYYAGQNVYWTEYYYDQLDRLTSKREPNDTGTGTTTLTTNDYSGLTTEVTDPRGKTTIVKNVVGQVSSIKDANNGLLSYTYDPNGNMVQSVDAKGNIISLKYDLRGRKTDLYDPDMGVWNYSYDALNQIVRQISPKYGSSQPTTFVYDKVGRMTSRSEPTLNSNWFYDTYSGGGACNKGIGKLCQATAGNGFSRKLYYDSLGRLNATGTTIGTTYSSSISYDLNGRIASHTYPTGLVINNSYTALGYLKQVIDSRNSSALWTANSMDALGHLTQYTYGNGIVTKKGYYANTGRLNTIQAGVNNNNSIQNLSQGYDNVGRLSNRIDGINNITSIYTYDSINRLTNESRTVSGTANAQVLAWSYDAIGNMLTRTENSIQNTYNYNTSGSGSLRPHAVASVSGYVNNDLVPVYTYDADGNMVTGAGRNVTWTSFDKVSNISENGKTLDYLYDGDHERTREIYSINGNVQRTVIYLNHAAGAGLAYDEENGVAGTKRNHYINAGGITVGVIQCNAATYTSTLCTNSANTFTQYWHQDHQGSNSTITSAAGSIVERLAYEPFGKRRNSNGLTDVNGTLQPLTTNRGYTEHEHIDEIALINMNGRIYDPALGRFLSADPMIQSPENLQSYNPYSYVWNNPLNMTDPSGYAGEDDLSSSLSNTGVTSWNIASENWQNSLNTLGSYNNISSTNSFSFIDTGIGSASNYSFATTPGLDLTAGYDSPRTMSSFQNINNSPTFFNNAWRVFKDDIWHQIEGPLMAEVGVAKVAGIGFFSLFKTEKAIENVAKLETLAEEGVSVWSLGAGPRGQVIEKALGQNLPSNFPTIDRFIDGTATSIKSIDLGASSYQNASKLNRTLTGYIDKIANYNGTTAAGWAGVRIDASQITARGLDLAIPNTGTAIQQQLINKAIQYGNSKGVQVNVIVYPGR